MMLCATDPHISLTAPPKYHTSLTSPPPRYERNIGHQAEILLPMLEAAARLGAAPALLHWPFNLTHWARQVAHATWPFTKLDDTPRSVPRRRCRIFRPAGSGGGRGGWLRLPAVAPLARAAVLRHCGIPEGRAPGSIPEGGPLDSIPEEEGAPGGIVAGRAPRGMPEGVAPGSIPEGVAGGRPLAAGQGVAPELFLESSTLHLQPPTGASPAERGEARATESPTGAFIPRGGQARTTPRPLKLSPPPEDPTPPPPAAQPRPRRAVLLLREDAPGGEPRHFAQFSALLRLFTAALPRHAVSVLRTRGDAGLCEQAAWVGGAEVVLSPHGAHLLNALWMEPHAALLEVGDEPALPHPGL